MIENNTAVKALIDKAAKAEKSEDAIRFSQAACNVANAIRTAIDAAIAAPSAPNATPPEGARDV